jgi:AbrB family looped-hinge helix DNA binding protein
MDVAAKLTSKGQVTIPKSVREALHLAEGDVVVFRIQGEHAVLARTPRLLELAGSITVPKSACGAKWEDVVEATKMARAPKRR